MLNIEKLRSNQIPVRTTFRGDIPFHMVIKPVGPACNLACRYCYYPQGNEQKLKMSDALLEKFIFQYIKGQPYGCREVNFLWQGGEPLLAGIGFYKKVLNLQKKYAPEGAIISNSLQTNGTLINDTWCDFFKKNNFLIGISLDGDKKIQDAHRPDRHNKSSYDNTVNGIKLLRNHNIDFNLLMVVHDGVVAQACDLYDHVVKLGARYLQFQPLVSSEKNLNSTYNLSAKNWGRFMIDIYLHWLRKGDLGKVFVMNVENIYAQYFFHISPTCVHASHCGSNLVVDAIGRIFSCDHLMNSDNYLGILADDTELTDYVKKSICMPFGINKSNRKECQDCSVKIVCHGGCPVHCTQGGNNSLCDGYYHFFSTVLEPLKTFSRDKEGVSSWYEVIRKNKIK